MTVDEVLQHAEQLNGQVVELQGHLLVILQDDEYRVYLSATDTLNGHAHIPLGQPLAAIRKIIQPMHTMLLSYHGELIQPPYYYNFPVYLWARVEQGAEGGWLLNQIASVRVYVPYPPNMAQVVKPRHYLYLAQVEYGTFREPASGQQARGKITMQKVLRFVESETTSRILEPDENCHARRILQQTVTIPGWLDYLPGVESIDHHFALRTHAVRAGVMEVGLLRGVTAIWWRPDPTYMVVRAHSVNLEAASQRADVTGRIAYVHDALVPLDINPLPQLVFTQIDEIVLYDEGYLVD